ncbi:MAG: molybdate ABC transporter substrate-binding protein [Vicinamibacterales bacterium]
MRTGTKRRGFAGTIALAAALAAALSACGGSPASPRQVTIFAAASLRTALDEVMDVCRQDTGTTIRASYAASSALARQIEAGAPADLYISADEAWMDDVAAKGGIRTDSRLDLLGNALVLVAPASAPVTLAVAPGFDLAGALDGGRLAVADPDVVPAGKYAKAALQSLGVWDSVADRLAPAEDVRAALLLVSRAEAPLGIVYRTDAAADPGVVVVDDFPAGSHPPIVYPAALTTNAAPDAARVLDCLRTPPARRIFDRWGFTDPSAAPR